MPPTAKPTIRIGTRDRNEKYVIAPANWLPSRSPYLVIAAIRCLTLLFDAMRLPLSTSRPIRVGFSVGGGAFLPAAPFSVPAAPFCRAGIGHGDLLCWAARERPELVVRAPAGSPVPDAECRKRLNRSASRPCRTPRPLWHRRPHAPGLLRTPIFCPIPRDRRGKPRPEPAAASRSRSTPARDRPSGRRTPCPRTASPG